MHKGKIVWMSILLLFFLTAGWISLGKVLDLPRRADAASHYQDLQLFTDVLTIVQKSYVEEVEIKDLVYGAINGMLSSLDPHSAFMPPEVYQEMKVDTKGEFGGLGIEISVRNGVLTIVSPIEDTPASRVGLQAGDMIIKIEDQFTKDLEIMDAVKLMRGPKGSEVSITIMRESLPKPKEYTLIREIIKVKSVKAKILENGFGYVRVTQFQERTSKELDMALDRLQEENNGVLQGVVLDLRNNPGGLLDQAVEVSDAFLSSGLIVYTEGREADSKMKFTAHKRGTEPDYPMVVLINGGSASASEIVAGALKDHKRAVLMGTQSFGKGSVQTILPLSDKSGLRLTTARYFTPNGVSIQAKGIEPDIIVLPGEVKEVKDLSHFREKDLKNHFGNHQDSANDAPADAGQELDEAVLEDYQLIRALDLLKGWQILQGKDKTAA